MPVRLTVALPEHALKDLIERYRRDDPELMTVCKECGVLDIQPHGEPEHVIDHHILEVWEDDGGR